MSRIFISGSSTGLGLMAGDLLINQGHQVVLHARNSARADDAKRALPRAEAIVEGDLETIAGAKDVAARVNDLGRFDAVIHNAAVGYREGHHLTADGFPHVAILSVAVARRWPDVSSNALEPGWVPTKMGGAGAPDDMDQAHLTQAWLAASDQAEAGVTGRYFYHLRPLAPNPLANNPELQDRLITICAELSGVLFPG